MRMLVVAYCFSSPGEEALIGVYKRGLRLALEAADQGHEVLFFCPGREGYHDDLTRRAEQRLRFVELPSREAAFDEAQALRGELLRAMAALALELVVVGEVPLAGPLYDATLAAAELEIPLVLLDNTYSPELVRTFCRDYGPMADGVILSGPTSFHHSGGGDGDADEDDSWPFLLQVPPYIELPRGEGSLGEAGWEGDEIPAPGPGESLLTVLAYDEKTESLGLSLLEALGRDTERGLRGAILTRRPERCRERLVHLPAFLRSRVRLEGPPPDPCLFQLFERSSLVVSKYGFMQTSECLALGTPVIATFHEGFTWLDHMPEAARRFTYATASGEATPEVVAAARRLLGATAQDLAAVHDGSLGAARRAVKFLDTVARAPRRDCRGECRRLGFAAPEVAAALSTLEGEREPHLLGLRAMQLRKLANGSIVSLLASYESAGAKKTARLWGRTYHSREAAERDHHRARAAGSGRTVLAFDPREPTLLELDPGQALLPEHEIYV